MFISPLVSPDLAGKAALATGGSTGIGAAVARGFAEQGAKVAGGCHASDASARRRGALVKDIKAAGGEGPSSKATLRAWPAASTLSPRRRRDSAASTA